MTSPDSTGLTDQARLDAINEIAYAGIPEVQRIVAAARADERRKVEHEFIVWLAEKVHYPFDAAWPDKPPPVDHDALADHWNEWDGWGIEPDEARAAVREEAGLS